MQNLLNELLVSLQKREVENQFSTLVFIANLTQKTLEPLELETISKICLVTYKNLYGNDFTMFKQFLEIDNIKISSYMIKVCNHSLWKAIWCNSLRHYEFIISNKSINNHTDFFIWCMTYIINNIEILDKNSLYLLRCLHLIINRIELSAIPSYSIIKLMNKVAVSPHQGFKQLACNITKILIPLLKPIEKSEICNIDLLPIRGIDTYELLNNLTDNFIKDHLQFIVIKVLTMFANNIENKDAGFLYKRILICNFEEWIDLVWPSFFSRLHQIEYEGEFFQSLVKYWIPLTINAYRTDFYSFIKHQTVDLRLKAYILLESRQKGFLFEKEQHIYNRLETIDLGLHIISTYKKKSLYPGDEEIDFLIQYLYSNLKSYLEDDEVASVRKIFSQIACVANWDLKKSDANFEFYANFVDKIYKYCFESFGTEFFEVGSQVLITFLDIFKGSHKDLKLIYKLEKGDHYEKYQNLLYLKLIENKLWKFYNLICPQIKHCLLKTDCSSQKLTNLVSQHYNQFLFMNPPLFKTIFNKIEKTPTLHNTEKIINCSNLLFSQKYTIEIEQFLKEIEDDLLQKIVTKNPNEEVVFKMVLYLEILTSAKKHRIEVKNIDEIIEESLLLIDYILESSYAQGISYRFAKVLETFITRVIFLISQNIHELWSQINKHLAIETLIKIIEKSNMKKPVSLSAELLRQFGSKLENDDTGRKRKTQLLNDTLEAINETPSKDYLRMRRNPESRLVIHALCVSQKETEKPFLHWTMSYLLKLMSNTDTTNVSMSSCLHTIELLISDNRLQQQTLSYIPDIIVKCIELFKRPNWIVRNANLQLTKSLIERLYGVSMNNHCRPKNIADLFVLYPDLASHFFKILSSDKLDDRSVILFQFFIESHIKENISDDIFEILEYFGYLLVHIIKKYDNQYGKLAVKSYVSICLSQNIPERFLDIAEFVKTDFIKLPKNIFANLMQLMIELYENYTGEVDIDHIWVDLMGFLKKLGTDLFDYLLIKVTTVDDILDVKKYTNNIWVHNNLTFFFWNANSSQIGQILKDGSFSAVGEFFHVRLMSILIQRYENNEFSVNDLEIIVESLFYNALNTKKDSNYLLNCYYKSLLILQDNIEVKLDFDATISSNLHQNLITLMYFTKKQIYASHDLNLILKNIKKNISINEDTDRDILSAITLSFPLFPIKFHPDISKIILHYSLFKSSHLEAFYLMSKITDKTYGSFLDALTHYFSVNRLKIDVNTFVSCTFNESNTEDEFYTTEDEILIPKSFIKKILS